MLEELLTISKSRQASQSGSTNAANMDIAPFKTLIEEAGQRTEAGLAKFAGNITDCLNAINNRIDGIARREQPDFGKIRELLEQATQKTDEASIRHNINETRHSFALENRWDWAIVIGIVLLIALLASTLYSERRQDYDRIDNDLKYRYIRMKGEASPESIAGLAWKRWPYTIYMRCMWKMLLMQRYGALSYRMHLRLYFSFRSIGCRLLLY